MSSTYSDLKIELIGTGAQVGTWGATTNVNLGENGAGLEQAIIGTANISFSSADVPLTLINTNAAQDARALRLNLTGTSGGARNLILGSGCQIGKPYIINNGLADAVTVKNTNGTGVAVPAGKTMWVYNNGTNVVEVMTHAGSLTLGSALPVASGGTGQTTYTNGQLLIGNTTGNTLTKATLTAGSGISITNGAGSITIDAISPGGDVSGPASATNNAVALFDGTTGKIIKDSAKTLPAGAVVGTTDTQTLTNKTLTSPTITNANASGTWGISITGNANTATSATNATNATNATTAAEATKLSTASGSAPSYSVRAWVNFNGTTNVGGNCTIRASGNVSTVADNGVGNYTVNFATAMPDANYAVSAITNRNNVLDLGGSTVTLVAGSSLIRSLFNSTSAATDSEYVTVIYIR